MNKIKDVIPKEDYRLEVLLENGSSIILNMANRLSNIRFSMLADKKFFQSATTDGDFVRWGYEIEISLNEVFQLAQK